jgi:hypothetical protein
MNNLIGKFSPNLVALVSDQTMKIFFHWLAKSWSTNVGIVALKGIYVNKNVFVV